MSKNVDVIAICFLLVAAILFGGVKELASRRWFGPGGLVRVGRDGSNFYVAPALPPMPPMPEMPGMPQVQRN